MKKSIYLSVIALFLLIAIISGMMIYAHFKEANTQDELNESLATVVEQNTESTQAEPSEAGKPEMLPEYAELYKQNSDVVGWITIPDTKIRKFFPDLWKQLEDWDNRTWRKFRADYSIKG